MKRRHVHIAFGVAAGLFAAAAIFEGYCLHQARRVNATIAAADMPDASLSYPEAQFAHALVLARNGDYEGALRAYKVLSREAPDAIATARGR